MSISPQLQFYVAGMKGYLRPQRALDMTFKNGNTVNPQEYMVWLYNARNSFSPRIEETGVIALAVSPAAFQPLVLIRVNGHDDPNGLGIAAQNELAASLAHGHQILSIPRTCGRRLFFSLDQSAPAGFTFERVEVTLSYPD